MLNIVADENIPLVEAFFGKLGTIKRLPGREMSPADLKDADLLLVRSVTRVDRALLAGSQVKFVGTCTIGTDHVDQDWLAEQGIGFASAPGCNAGGVVNYVLSVLSVLAERQGFSWWQKKIGIVGAGNVGGRLYECLSRLGVECLVCDPFRKDEPGFKHTELDQLLADVDIVSLHTPLTHDGPYPTYHLLNKERLALMGEHSILLNSGRGPVIDNEALKLKLAKMPQFTVALDVWEFEPEVDLELMHQVDLATPHIGGYSIEGKCNGTAMIYQAACHHYELPEEVSLENILPKPALQRLGFSPEAEARSSLDVAIRTVYDVRRDDAIMRRRLLQSACPRSEFDLLRKQYPERREFSSLTVEWSSAEAELFRAAGFRLC